MVLPWATVCFTLGVFTAVFPLPTDHENTESQVGAFLLESRWDFMVSVLCAQGPYEEDSWPLWVLWVGLGYASTFINLRTCVTHCLDRVIIEFWSTYVGGLL